MIKPIIRGTGWKMDRVPYSMAAKENAIEYIQRLRTDIELPDPNAMAGERFNNDERVFLRLESNYQEVEFRSFPMECVAGALIACAESDYWYTYEKDWGNLDDYEDEEVDGC